MPQAPTVTNTGNGNGMASRQARNGTVSGIAVRVGWPTERWMGAIVLTALGLLILIRFGFKGLGFQGNIGARVNV